jgi:hypothetical protein
MSAEQGPTGKTESAQAAPEALAPDESRDAAVATPDGINDVLDLPAGWKYRQRRIFGLTLPWYASPKIQLGMVSFVCFMCPGMFNALGGLGGGGKTDATLADNMVSKRWIPGISRCSWRTVIKQNTALYSAFAVFGFFGGTFINKLGVKWTLAFGGVGYCIYAISLLVSVHADVSGFNLFAGTWLGICAGLLWTAQGTIMISYPHEDQKGRYFAWFWGIFNMGAVIGSLVSLLPLPWPLVLWSLHLSRMMYSLARASVWYAPQIPLGENIGVKSNSTVTDGTYIGFIVLMFCGAVLALFLCNAGDIIRPDGSRVILMKHPSWQSELIGLWETLRFEPFVVLLFPMFFSSNWFYVYQQNAVNGAHFDTRTKALNNLLYYLAQIVAAVIWGYLLDIQGVRRSLRAKLTWGVLVVLTFVIWGGGYVYEEGYTRESVDPKLNPDFVPTDWSTPGYVGPMFLYIFYGFYDAAWQASVYWYDPFSSFLFSQATTN